MKTFHLSWRKLPGPGRICLYVIMTALVAFMVLPLIYMISTAFKPMEELFLYPPRFFVKRPVLTNFQNLFGALSSSSVPFSRYVLNSLFTTVVTVLLTVLVSSAGAYGLVKLKPRGSGFIMAVVIAALMFSSQVTAIPAYMVVSGMGLINSYAALILPKIAVAFNFFLMKQFMEQVPDALLEAARIDGAGAARLYLSLGLPLAVPVLCIQAVNTFAMCYNDFMWPSIIISETAKQPLMPVLRNLANVASLNSQEGASYAMYLMSGIPLVFTTLIGLKYFIGGEFASGMKL